MALGLRRAMVEEMLGDGSGLVGPLDLIQHVQTRTTSPFFLESLVDATLLSAATLQLQVAQTGVTTVLHTYAMPLNQDVHFEIGVSGTGAVYMFVDGVLVHTGTIGARSLPVVSSGAVVWTIQGFGRTGNQLDDAFIAIGSGSAPVHTANFTPGPLP